MIAIIGGGISGLSIALELQKWCEPCIVFEQSNRPGGVIKSVHKQGYLMEYGPASLLADADIHQYLKSLDLDSEILTAERSKKKYILRNGKYHQAPSDPLSFVFSPLLSIQSKATILKEFLKKSQPAVEETISAFIERRFNKEIADYIAAPIISGIYAGDITKLLLAETFPSLKIYEEKFGSILKGFVKNKIRKDSLYFKGGMQTLTDKIAANVKRVSLNSKVEQIKKTEDGFTLRINKNGHAENFNCKAIVFATPARQTAQILKDIYPHIYNQLQKVEYAPISKVFLGFSDTLPGRYYNGMGALNPPAEKQLTMGQIWNTSIYPHVSPEDRFLFTCIGGGMHNKNITGMSDEQVTDKMKSELAEHLPAGTEPVFEHTIRISEAIAQADSELVNARNIMSALEAEYIFTNAAWYGGPALSDCLKNSKKNAIRITETMSGIAEYKGCC